MDCVRATLDSWMPSWTDGRLDGRTDREAVDLVNNRHICHRSPVKGNVLCLLSAVAVAAAAAAADTHGLSVPAERSRAERNTLNPARHRSRAALWPT